MTAVQHIGFNCRDRLISEDFYTRFFGFRRVRVFNPGQPHEFVMLRLGATCLELFGAGPDSAQAPGDAGTGFKHLAFEVTDIEAKAKELTDAGIQVGELIDCSALVPRMRVCFFKDPDGNVLEIMENWSDEQNPPQR